MSTLLTPWAVVTAAASPVPPVPANPPVTLPDGAVPPNPPVPSVPANPPVSLPDNAVPPNPPVPPVPPNPTLPANE